MKNLSQMNGLLSRSAMKQIQGGNMFMEDEGGIGEGNLCAKNGGSNNSCNEGLTCKVTVGVIGVCVK